MPTVQDTARAAPVRMTGEKKNLHSENQRRRTVNNNTRDKQTVLEVCSAYLHGIAARAPMDVRSQQCCVHESLSKSETSRAGARGA